MHGHHFLACWSRHESHGAVFAGFFAGDYGSDIDISVVHPDAIGIQNPYEALNYENLPESP